MLTRRVSFTGWGLVLLTVAMCGAQTARAQFGIAAGGNFNQLTDINTEPRTTFDNATGFHVGVFYDLALGPLALRPGVFYVDVGRFEASAGSARLGSFDLNLIAIPVDVRVRTVTVPVVRPYVLAGPVFRFARTGDKDFEESLNKLSYAGNVGIGVEIGAPGGGVTFSPELRYAFGVTGIFNDFTFLGRSFSADSEQHLNMFMLRLNLSF